LVLLAASGLGLVAAWPALVGLLAGEKFSRGKPGSYWLRSLHRAATPEAERRAAEALRPLGETAVPGLVGLLVDNDPQVRVRAARALELLGKQAKAAEPALLRALADGEAGGSAVRALCALGPEPNTVEAIVRAGWPPVPQVHFTRVSAAEHQGARKRAEAIRRAFAEAIRPLVAASDPAVVLTLRSADARVRQVVSACVEENAIFIKGPPERLLAALKQAAEDADGRVRANARAALRFLLRAG
jgi:HEAT repeat protein